MVGGESTGKSTLAAALGTRLPGLVVAEGLRRWVDRHGRVPLAAEQESILEAHRSAECSALRSAGRTGQSWVISDSGPLMTAIYSMQYYDDGSLLPTALAWAAQAELVVWCQDDFPWQPDPQRDGPAARAGSQQLLATVFAENPALPMLAVHGSLDARVDTVLAAVATR